MMPRTILTMLEGGAADIYCLTAAGALAQRQNAHVLALLVDQDPGDILSGMAFDIGGGAYFTNELMDSLQNQLDARRAEAKKNFSDWRSTAGLPEVAAPPRTATASASMSIEIGSPQTVTRSYALVADLVVAALPTSKDIDSSIRLEAALFDAGRPVLALPRKPITPFDRAPIAVAWNESAEAARALSAALPFLRHAQRVLLLHAGPVAKAIGLDRVVSYLSWHGIEAQGEELGDSDVPEQLIVGKASEIGAAMLVMGAYSHSRAREFVFGGVTRYMMQSAQLPLLLAH
jgi:nucleotide-binding universal stress UspA family protein